MENFVLQISKELLKVIQMAAACRGLILQILQNHFHYDVASTDSIINLEPRISTGLANFGSRVYIVSLSQAS